MLSPVPIVLNAQTVSGITGSISIACWIVVFVPQIYENFYRKSADGLSLLFVVLWLAGDVFNVIGAIMQKLLPTMIILAAYYTAADILLFVQCLQYDNEDNKTKSVDPVHLSPANPLSHHIVEVFDETQPLLTSGNEESSASLDVEEGESSSTSLVSSTSITKTYNSDSIFIRNLKEIMIVLSVILGGFLFWYISYCNNPKSPKPTPPEELTFNITAQVFGYLSAVLYLGSRVPQILLNFKRKSVEGISFLFFLFACLGNTTFIISVLSISMHPRYLLVNASWLVGSSGTLVMDFIIFTQFFVYGTSDSGKEGTVVNWRSNDFREITESQIDVITRGAAETVEPQEDAKPDSLAVSPRSWNHYTEHESVVDSNVAPEQSTTGNQPKDEAPLLEKQPVNPSNNGNSDLSQKTWKNLFNVANRLCPHENWDHYSRTANSFDLKKSAELTMLHLWVAIVKKDLEAYAKHLVLYVVMVSKYEAEFGDKNTLESQLQIQKEKVKALEKSIADLNEQLDEQAD
ncbi:hypothetical protein ACO0QE_000315 [Hanseniaspora vineae]